MKQNITLHLAAIILIGTSCRNNTDDDVVPTTDFAQEIAGTYTVYDTSTSMINGQTTKVFRISNGHITRTTTTNVMIAGIPGNENCAADSANAEVSAATVTFNSGTGCRDLRGLSLARRGSSLTYTYSLSPGTGNEQRHRGTAIKQ